MLYFSGSPTTLLTGTSSSDFLAGFHSTSLLFNSSPILGDLLNPLLSPEEWLPMLGHKRHSVSVLLFFGLLALGEVSWSVMRTLEQLYAEADMTRNRRLLPTAREEPRPLTTAMWVTHLESGSLIQSSFQMSAAPTDGLTATSWEIPTQNNQTKFFPDSWLSGIMLDNKCLLLEVAKLWGDLLCSNR